MKGMGVLSVCIMVLLGCKAAPPASSSEPDHGRLQRAIAATMDDARHAIDAHGASETGLSKIVESMARLAGTPGLIEGASLHQIHGNVLIGQQALASEGAEGINLYITRLEPGARTPVHDHTAWGVVYVLEGRDRYVRWERIDDGAAPEQASLRSADERLLRVGDSVFWFSPPRDIHSQEAAGAVLWELVMTGRDLSHATASGRRHWFDPGTGKVSHEPPK